MLVQVLPKSVLLSTYGLKSPTLWLSNDAYSVFVSCCENSARDTYVLSGTPGKCSILRHAPPPSSEIWIRPSSVPTTSSPSFFVLSDSATMLP